jgi:hypothetical protein
VKLGAELRRWQARTGGSVHVFRPDRQIAALARHPLDLFDKERAAAAYPLAFEQARGRLLQAPELAALISRPAPAPVA